MDSFMESFSTSSRIQEQMLRQGRGRHVVCAGVESGVVQEVTLVLSLRVEL